MTNKRKAIKLLENQKAEFISKSYVDRELWKQKTGSLLIEFLGEESSEYYAFANFKFGIWTLDPKSKETDFELKRRNDLIVGLLDNCIDKIKRNGLRNQSSGFLKNKYLIRIKSTINAIKTLNPIWKFIISIVAMIISGFLTYILIEWYKTLSYV